MALRNRGLVDLNEASRRSGELVDILIQLWDTMWGRRACNTI